MSAVLELPVDKTPPSRFASLELWIGGTLMGCIVLLALFGPALAMQDAAFIDLHQRFLPLFSQGHLLSTDQLGHDLLARVLSGLRWSFAKALCATLIAFTIGTTL